VDETFSMAELGSVVVTFADLIDAANYGSKTLHIINQNAQHGSKSLVWWKGFDCARFWLHPCNRNKKSFVVISAKVGEDESKGLISCTFEVGNIIRSDWATKSDPVVCALLFDEATQVHIPTILPLLILPSANTITTI
jgi:hypothetical protein